MDMKGKNSFSMGQLFALMKTCYFLFLTGTGMDHFTGPYWFHEWFVDGMWGGCKIFTVHPLLQLPPHDLVATASLQAMFLLSQTRLHSQWSTMIKCIYPVSQTSALTFMAKSGPFFSKQNLTKTAKEDCGAVEHSWYWIYVLFIEVSLYS